MCRIRVVQHLDETDDVWMDELLHDRDLTMDTLQGVSCRSGRCVSTEH